MILFTYLDMFDDMQNIDMLIDKYLEELRKSYKDFDKNKNMIKKACDVAKLAHDGQFRKYSGNPFIAHPLRVAVMVSEKTDNLESILAAILHDTVEDKPDKVSMKYIYKEFWEEVWYLVDSVTANILYYYNEPKIIFKDKLDKLLTGMMKDARCVFLKLMDREHNNKTLEGLNTNKQIRKSFETQALYSPLRDMLRIDKSNFVLKDVCKLVSYYLDKNNIKTVEQLKSNLYNLTFQDIDSESFEAFYYSSDSIVWKIEDKELLENLMSHHSFDDNIEVVSISQTSSWEFSCLFKYKKWQIFDWNFKANISSFTK